MSLLDSLIGRYTHRRVRSGPDDSTPIAANAAEPSTPPAPALSPDAPSEPPSAGPTPEHPAMRSDPLMQFAAEPEPGRGGRKPHFIFYDAPPAAAASTPATASTAATPPRAPASTIDGVLGQLQQAAEGVQTVHARVDEVVAMVANVSVDRQQIDATAREAHTTAAAALDGVREISNRVAALEALGSLARPTDERLTAGDALADRVGTAHARMDETVAMMSNVSVDRQQIDATAREAHATATAALGGLQELSNRVAALEGAGTLARQADERLTAVNALAEKVSTHAAVLDRLEAAIGWQTATLREQVSAIDRVRGDADAITRLAQGVDAKLAAVDAREKSTAPAADMLARLERAAEDCNALLGNVDTARRDLSEQMNRLDEVVRASASARQVVATSAAPRPDSGPFRAPLWPAWSAVASTWVNRFAKLRIPRPVLVATSVTAALLAFIVWQLIPLTYQKPVAVQQVSAPEIRVSAPEIRVSAPEIRASAPEIRVSAPEIPGSASTQAGGATIGEPAGAAARNSLASPRAVTPAAPVIAQTAGPPSVARDVPRTARAISAPLFIGALTIDSDPPGAAVLIDHRPAGQTPLHVSRLRAGSHVVAVERGGYERWTAAVSVVADTTTRVRARLQVDRAQ